MQTLTSWTAMPGFLLLTPITLPSKTEAGILLPESVTTKTNSGLCVAAGATPDYDTEQQIATSPFMGKEIFFNRHDEYQVVDSDTGKLFFVLHDSKIVLWRNPADKPKFFPISHGSEAGILPLPIRRETSEPTTTPND